MKYSLVLVAFLAYSNAHKLNGHNQHACDFLDESGEEISTSLVDNENAREIVLHPGLKEEKLVQLKDDDDTPE